MDARPSKRHKTPLACENCRRQKIKCDGGRPACGNCSRKGRSEGDCVWKHVDGRPEAGVEPGQPPLDMLRALEERIRHLESRGGRSSSVDTGAIPDGSQSQSMSPGPGSGHIVHMDAAVMTSAVPRSEGFMGSASAMSIMNMVREAVDPTSPAPFVTVPASAETVSSSTVSLSSRLAQALPTRSTADKLAAVYWGYIHPLYPFLYKPHLQAIMRNMWEGEPLPTMLCTTLGRPVMTAVSGTDQTPLPSELDEELFQSGGQLLHDPCSAMSFFVQSARLFEIVQQTLQAFYSEDSPTAAPGSLDDFTGYTIVFEIDAQLSRWLAMVPTHLQLDRARTAPTDDTRPDGMLNTHTLRRQAIVLRIRFLLARLYLFKPVLSRTCMAVRTSQAHVEDETAASPFAYSNARQMESLSRRTSFQCSLLCVQTAIEMIYTIGGHQTTAAAWGLKPSWLYGALHVYLSATVLLAARLAPAVLLGEISQDQIQDVWHRALDILGRFQADNVSANRCVTALVLLYRKLPGGTLQNGGQRTTGSHDAFHVSADEHLETGDVPSTLGPGSWGLPPDMDFDQEFNMEWMPDLQLADPYDMTWFQATAPDFGLTQN